MRHNVGYKNQLQPKFMSKTSVTRESWNVKIYNINNQRIFETLIMVTFIHNGEILLKKKRKVTLLLE